VVKPLTERDIEVLETLVYMRYESGSKRFYEHGTAPLDFGGSNGSHHGKTATKLVAHGFVEQKQRGHDWGDVLTNNARGSKLYRATDAGRTAILAHRALKNGYTSGGMKRKWGSTIPTTRNLTDAEKRELRLKCHLEMPA
jgi:hypothetical protein